MTLATDIYYATEGEEPLKCVCCGAIFQNGDPIYVPHPGAATCSKACARTCSLTLQIYYVSEELRATRQGAY